MQQACICCSFGCDVRVSPYIVKCACANCDFLKKSVVQFLALAWLLCDCGCVSL
jgi:hypothetical protein